LRWACLLLSPTLCSRAQMRTLKQCERTELAPLQSHDCVDNTEEKHDPGSRTNDPHDQLVLRIQLTRLQSRDCVNNAEEKHDPGSRTNDPHDQ
jgi:hypothetical protein